VEMRAKGMSQIEIARELQVSDSSISSDVQYLREQAKGTIKEYATDHLPEQYQVCLVALDEIIKRAFDILENSDENREKLQAMDQGYRSRLTLGSTIITINFVKSGWQTAF
jgi:transcriptional regulator